MQRCKIKDIIIKIGNISPIMTGLKINEKGNHASFVSYETFSNLLEYCLKTSFLKR